MFCHNDRVGVLAEAVRARARASQDPRQQAALEHAWAQLDAQRRRAARRATKALREVDRPALWSEIEAALDRMVSRLCAEDSDVAPMLADDVFDDSQPQPGASLFPGA